MSPRESSMSPSMRRILVIGGIIFGVVLVVLAATFGGLAAARHNNDSSDSSNSTSSGSGNPSNGGGSGGSSTSGSGPKGAPPASAARNPEAIAKAQKLVSQLTLREKVTLTTGIGWGTTGTANGDFDPQNNPTAPPIQLAPGWTGEQSVCVGNTGKVQSINFPGLCLQDSTTGVRFANKVSAFPAGINVAATFDKTLMRMRGEAMGEEFRGKGVNIALAPSVNFMRTPNGGRGWESFGADPHLQSINAALFIDGIQSKGVMATVKHFVLNEDEYFRETKSVSVDRKTLHEVYLRPFKAAVDAGVAAVMTAYNKVNHVYASENNDTIAILKNEMGFTGFVMTDWFAGHSTSQAANAGLDMEMPGSMDLGVNDSWWGEKLIDAVKAGEVPESRVTDMAVRILSGWLGLGQDANYPPVNINVFELAKENPKDVQGDHKKVIRDIGAASAILLQNNGAVLPITTSKVKTIAIIGFGAGPEDKDLASYLDNFNGGGKFGEVYTNQGDGGSGDHSSLETAANVYGNIPQGWGSGTAWFPYLVTPLSAITKRAGTDYKIVHLLDNFNVDAATALAKTADIALVFVSADSGEEFRDYGSAETCSNGQAVGGNPGDRQNVSLWFGGDDLVNAVASGNPNTVVIINGPGAVDMPWISNVKGVIHNLFPGQESGNGVTDVLFGDVNPSGRLPFTIAKHVNDYPVLSPMPTCDLASQSEQVQNYSEGRYFDYPFFDSNNVAPLFPFGHGLSYTTFQYSNLKLNVNSPGSVNDTTVSVAVNVANAGPLDGNEVVQLYLAFPPDADQPARQLKGFERVFIANGQSTTVNFQLGFDELSFWDKGWHVAPGQYNVSVGASSRDLRVSATFTL